LALRSSRGCACREVSPSRALAFLGPSRAARVVLLVLVAHARVEVVGERGKVRCVDAPPVCERVVAARVRVWVERDRRRRIHALSYESARWSRIRMTFMRGKGICSLEVGTLRYAMRDARDDGLTTSTALDQRLVRACG